MTKTNDKTVIDKIRELEGYAPTGEETETLRKMRESAVDAYERARDATKEILDATNVMGRDIQEAVEAGVVQGIWRTHNHLGQQGIVAILKALSAWGNLPESTSSYVDPRNRHARETCKALKEFLRERHVG